MKMKKRFLSILLSLVMVLGLMPGMSLTAFAASHNITINNAQHGTVTASVNGSAVTSADEGTIVTLTANPEDGYRLKSISGTYKDYSSERLSSGSFPFKSYPFTIDGTSFTANIEDGNASNDPWYLRNNKGVTINAKGDSLITKVVFSVNNKGRFATSPTATGGTMTETGNTITINCGTGQSSVKLTGSGTNNATTIALDSYVVIYGKSVVDTPLSIAASGVSNVCTFTMPAVVEGNVIITAEFEESEKQPATVTKVPEAKTLTYNGSAQALVTAGTAEGGTMQYALGTETEATQPYTTSIPTVTNAGTYYVWYKAVGDGDHTDSKAKVVTVTIKKKGEAHTHTIKLVDAKESTCTEDGYKEHYECSECGAWFGDITGVSEITDKSGYTIKATGHDWGSYEVITRPTYDEEGLKIYTCKNDPSHTKEETIPKLSGSSDSDSDTDNSDGSNMGSRDSRDSSSGKSSSTSAEVQSMIDQINTTSSVAIPENHQVETGVAASDVGGNWDHQVNADNWTYTKSDGTLAKSEWMSLDYNGLRYWYYFNDDGNMRTNWFDYNNERFYLMPEKDGWRGRMATGWKNIENKWYYFETVPGSSQGRLYRSSVTPDGHTVGADGAWNGVGETPVGQK